MSKHVKRLDQPRRWTIPKKDYTWAPKPRPGAHSESDALPLVAAVRNLLEVVDEAREAKQAVADGRVHVDGRPCRDHRRGLGFMDAVSLPDADLHYRVLFDQHGRFALLEIDEDEASSKLVRIQDKHTLEGDRRQLNLHDGRNVVVKEDDYATGDVIRITLPDQEIADHFPREAGAPVYVTGGTHIGQIATIDDLTTVRSSAPNLVQLEAETEFQTVEDYVFVVGEDEPTIDIPEGDVDG